MVLLFFSSLSPFVASSMPPSLVSSPLTSIRHPMLHPVGQATGPQGTPQGKTCEMSWSCLRCHCVLRILLPRNKLPSASSVIMTLTLSVRQTVPTLRTAWFSPHWGRLIGSPNVCLYQYHLISFQQVQQIYRNSCMISSLRCFILSFSWE